MPHPLGALSCPTPRPSESNKRHAIVLFALVLPISYIFLALVNLMSLGHTSITPSFLAGYSAAAVLQVALLLMVTGKVVRIIWNRKCDPDQVRGASVAVGALCWCAAFLVAHDPVSQSPLFRCQVAIPFVTALGDLIGTAVLVACFSIVRRTLRVLVAAPDCPHASRQPLLCFASTTAVASWRSRQRRGRLGQTKKPAQTHNRQPHNHTM